MVARQLERIQRAQRLDDIVLATSTDPSDDPLVAWAEAKDITVFRGSQTDILMRFIKVIDHFQPDVVVRLTADCPFTFLRSSTRLSRGSRWLVFFVGVWGWDFWGWTLVGVRFR